MPKVSEPKPEKPKAPEKPKTPARPIKYPKYKQSIAAEGYDGAITVARAKQLMGYEEETDTNKFGADFLFSDERGVKIRCHNNTINRPYDDPTARKYAQDILKGKWKINGETIIIGETEQVLSGQHRLIGLILAEQIRTGPEKHYWVKFWDKPLIIESFMSFGVKEDIETMSTLDNVRTRTLTDIICTVGLFPGMTLGDQKTLGKMLDYCVRMLWYRTGLKDRQTSFAPYLTHSEAIDFIGRHPRVLEAIKHIKEENKNQKISKTIPAGYAAAFLYLMAASNTTEDSGYRDFVKGDLPNEKNADLSQWKKACTFWSLLAKGGPETEALRKAFAALNDPETGEPGSLSEKVATICKAWEFYKAGQPYGPGALALNYAEKEGKWMLVDYPSLGGIDHGPEKPKTKKPKAPPTPAAAADAAATKPKTPKTPKAGGEVTTVVSDIKTMVEGIRKKNPGRLLLFKLKTGNLTAYGSDAEAVSKVSDLKLGASTGYPAILITQDRADDIVRALTVARHQVAYVNPDGSVTDKATSAAPPKPKPTETAKPVAPTKPSTDGPGLIPKPKGPTAAESLAKQKAKDAALRGGTN